jgi:exonuclease SbcD
MEKVRAVYPNALHVERKVTVKVGSSSDAASGDLGTARREADPVTLFAAFYEEVKGVPLTEDKQKLFADTYAEVLREEGGAV